MAAIVPLLTAWTVLAFAASFELTVPRRKDPDLIAKLFGLAVTIALFLYIWSTNGDVRLPLLASFPAALALRHLRSRKPLVWIPKIGLVLGTPLLAWIAFVALLGTFSPFGHASIVSLRTPSPDGKWEAQLVEHPGIAYCVDEIVLVPKGAARFNPLVLPSVTLGETVVEAELQSMKWTDKDTLVLFIRPQTPEPPYLEKNLPVTVKVVNLPPLESVSTGIPDKIEDITPPDKPSPAASPRPR